MSILEVGVKGQNGPHRAGCVRPWEQHLVQGVLISQCDSSVHQSQWQSVEREPHRKLHVCHELTHKPAVKLIC